MAAVSLMSFAASDPGIDEAKHFLSKALRIGKIYEATEMTSLYAGESRREC